MGPRAERADVGDPLAVGDWGVISGIKAKLAILVLTPRGILRPVVERIATRMLRSLRMDGL